MRSTRRGYRSDLDSQPVSALARLIGLEVNQVWVWWSLRLVFDLGAPGEKDTYVDFTEFDFTDPNGQTRHVDVEADPIGAGQVLAVLHQRVTDLSVDQWELRIAFANGARLVCPPHPRYEAWAASIPGEPSIFCPPGGDAGPTD